MRVVNSVLTNLYRNNKSEPKSEEIQQKREKGEEGRWVAKREMGG
jgi:hypothetical protein